MRGAPESFCVLILSHGRPDNLATLAALHRQGYTGPWYIVIDDEDPTGQEYRDRYGDHVVTFSKSEVAQTFDQADLVQDRRTVVYARNASFQIAQDLGYRYFLQLDDDYRAFEHRFEKNGALHYVNAVNLDRLCRAMVTFLEATGATSVAFGQGGDLIGGIDGSKWKRKVLRKAMNSFFCRSADQWRFLGRVNEDVNTYVLLSHRGHLFLTTVYCTVNQIATQSQPGGMTEAYLKSGTYAKSFYPVMMCPSAVQIRAMRAENSRIHHQVDWNHCAPRIISEDYRKPLAPAS
jgi:hypothetical protein